MGHVSSRLVNFKYFDAASQQEQLRNTQYQPFLQYQQAIKTALMSESQLRPKEFKDAIEQLEIDVNKDNVKITQREKSRARQREEGHKLYPSEYDSTSGKLQNRYCSSLFLIPAMHLQCTCNIGIL